MSDKKFKEGDIIRITESGDMVCDHRIDPMKQLWVVDEEAKSRPHGYTIYGLFTLDKAGELYESAAPPYAMELVEFPTSEEQEYAWHIKAALDKSREKIKLEDMTLSQIRELKYKLRQRVCYAVKQVLIGFEEDYGIESKVSSLWAEREVIETEQGDELMHDYEVHATIHFNGEEI